ncbi:MAG: glutamine amidotransferase [Mycobacteriales bacterium]
MSAVRIVSVLPALLGTYGDGGNVLVLRKRLEWRGIEVEVVTTSLGDGLPVQGDLYVLGGGEDDAQAVALAELRHAGLASVVARGTPVLAVCAGLQLLGRSLPGPEGRETDGLGVLDLRTWRSDPRSLGEVVARPAEDLGLPLLTGFANHSGATELGPCARPLATVLDGPGNAGPGDVVEGVLQGPVVGTYLHGPVLARNPALADLLLERAVGESLQPLPEGPMEAVRAERLGRALKPKGEPAVGGLRRGGR